MKKIILLSLLFLCLPYAASAASASISQMPQDIGVGDTVAVFLRVSASTPVNTFSGMLLYPKGKLELMSLNDGNSVINLWLTKPTGGTDGIVFEGLVPGGYSGNDGMLFTAFFKAKEPGSAEVSLDNAVFLRNDGSGSAEDVSNKALVINIAAQARGGYTESADTDPPEPFYIQLGSSPDLFDGRSYVAFTAADKGSGISHYDVAESRIPFMPLRWRRAESPSVLEDQYLTSGAYVKAVDNAGNERVAAYPRTHVFRPYELLALGILIVLFALYYYVKRKV